MLFISAGKQQITSKNASVERTWNRKINGIRAHYGFVVIADGTKIFKAGASPRRIEGNYSGNYELKMALRLVKGTKFQAFQFSNDTKIPESGRYNNLAVVGCANVQISFLKFKFRIKGCEI